MRARLLLILPLVLAIVSAGLAAAAPARAATLARVEAFGANPGALAMFAHRPPGAAAGAPVVVALHGCTQDAAGYAAGSGWTELADRWGFTVVLPQQSTANNGNRCFNWFQPGDVARGQGEVASLRSMVAHAVGTWGADPERVFVSGLSAGGAMASALLAAYPDVFSAGSIIAGIPVGCARDTAGAFSCMSSPPSRSPAQWAASVRAAAPPGTSDWPEVSIWHGTADTTVRPGNATASRDQWTAVHGLGQTPSATTSLPAATTRQDYGDGVRRVTTFSVQGMAHATPNDPGPGPQQCGAAAAYFADTLCSSYYDGLLWGLDGGGSGEPVPPPPPPPPTPTGCWTSSNYAHTQAGRATHRAGYAYAVGSDDDLGLWNAYVTSSLQQTGPSHYDKVSACA